MKYPIYIGIVVVTFFVRETYPFSMYPMYNNFPNWSYTFYFEDQNNANLNDRFAISYGSLGHLYFAECHKNCFTCGLGKEPIEELQIIGNHITLQALNMRELKAAGLTKIHLFRINNYIKDGKIQSDTVNISTTDVR